MLRLFPTIATLGTPRDITLQELRIVAPLRAAVRETAVLYCVQKDVRVLHAADPAFFERLKAAETMRTQELQRAGKWPHLWRVAGRYVNVAIFDVVDHDELHSTLCSALWR
jgi:muconolactone D-isomerase